MEKEVFNYMATGLIKSAVISRNKNHRKTMSQAIFIKNGKVAGACLLEKYAPVSWGKRILQCMMAWEIQECIVIYEQHLLLPRSETMKNPMELIPNKAIVTVAYKESTPQHGAIFTFEESGSGELYCSDMDIVRIPVPDTFNIFSTRTNFIK